jgi:hypothetical protein
MQHILGKCPTTQPPPHLQALTILLRQKKKQVLSQTGMETRTYANNYVTRGVGCRYISNRKSLLGHS